MHNDYPPELRLILLALLTVAALVTLGLVYHLH